MEAGEIYLVFGGDFTGAANGAPVAADDAYATDEDTQLLVTAPGVLGNDTDVDGAPLTAVLVAGQNFSNDPNVLVFILVAAIIGLVILGGVAGELGKRSQTQTEGAAPEPKEA